VEIEATGAHKAVHTEYVQRKQQREEALAHHARQDLALSRARVATALGAILTIWLAFGQHLFSGWWLAVPLLGFLALVAWHDRVIQRKRRAQRAVAFYEEGLRRLEHRWQGRGIKETIYAPASHPYAADLDILGSGSLLELLCTARTRGGERCLANWLLHGADPVTILARQEALADLRDRLDFREELALLGEETRSEITPETLTEWGEAPLALSSKSLRAVAALLGAGGGLAAILWPVGLGYLPLIVMVVLGQAFAVWLRKPVLRTLRDVDRAVRDLALLSALLGRLECEPFHTPLLQALRFNLDTEGLPPSTQIRRLQTLLDFLDLQRNIFFALIALVLLWPVQFAFAIEAWRQQNGPRLTVWLRVVSELEALSALANYAYENPDNPFPEIVEEETCFVAEGLGHPLLPEEQTIRNDIALGNRTQLFVVSGSNMSGKSTLLRAIGVNTVMALAGAPVRAKRLRLSPLQIGASLRTLDSLQGGVSRFYAEILRLNQIVDMAKNSPPLLFLLDEILHGTNSHDRLIGAEAIARSLVRQGAIGLITTHDLALARIETESDLRAVNVHFEDQLLDGKMSFDYHLRPGVVAKSNALELMRAVGLDI